MSFHVALDSLHDIHQCLMETLLDDPDYESAPRGKPIKELIGASFTLMNPRARLIDSPARNLNYGFAVGELCWYIRGDNDLAAMQFYNKRMAQFSDDGETINSAYGYRMGEPRWGKRGGGPYLCRAQIDNVLEELVRDSDSRRAVFIINEPNDLNRAVDVGSKDVPCTLSLQLFIRDRKLHMHTVMRSNDIAWGFPYDVFSFTCLMEAFLYRLQDDGAPVDDMGHYHHTAGSLHLYDTHYEMAGLVSKERLPSPAPMAPFTLEKIVALATEEEPEIRSDSWADLHACPRYEAHEDSIGWMYEQLIKHKNKRILENLRNQDKTGTE
jgi:thymidylate synthase